ESLVCDAFWNRYSVGIWYAAGIDIDITAGLLDAFERGTVYGQILQHRESCRSPRLDYDGLAIVKATHVQRSEERRVGKEWTSRGTRGHCVNIERKRAVLVR